MTYQEIINSINLKIENSNFSRFSLESVLSELNGVYRDLANKTDVFETYDYIQLVDNQYRYVLPDMIYRPTRAVFRGKKVSFMSMEMMDKEYSGWEASNTDSDIQYLVYNNLSDRKLTVYPRPLNVAVTSDLSEITFLGELVEASDNVNTYLYINENTGAKYLAPTATAIVDDLIEVITIFGSYLPPKVIEDNLLSERIFLDETQVNSLIYGTAGYILQNTGRTEDRDKGNAFLRLYGVDKTEFDAIRQNDFDDGIRNLNRNTGFRTPFDS